MSGMLYEIRGIDASSLAAGRVMLTVISVASSYLPARRAARVNPVVALRAE